MRIKILTTPTCPYCKKAKGFLKNHDLDFEERDVKNDPGALPEMMKDTDVRPAPVTEVR